MHNLFADPEIHNDGRTYDFMNLCDAIASRVAPPDGPPSTQNWL